ncbi:hypothetical protein GCM10009613_31120 [Pseudonocardia kongjuensis]|uniref:DUF2877 domain-containing protein n=1 Tax=Pseudonocardia kongjuensis TaxID=102227 RepID=A0ABP4IKF6_9PSEU
MIAVSAPVRVRDRLRSAADGPLRIVHRGPAAVYLAVGGECVGVTARHAVAVPCALHTRLGRLEVSRAELRDGVLHLDGEPLRIRRFTDTRVPPLPAGALSRPGTSRADGPAGALARPGTSRADGTGRPAEPGAATRPATGTTSAIAVLPGRVCPATVPGLVGRGDGLTPLGDDVLCGWLALHRAAGAATPAVDAAVRAHLHRTTLLSATLLRCALDGEVVDRFARFVAALGSPAEQHATAALTAVGHTSGAGMLHGARLALRELHPPRRAGRRHDPAQHDHAQHDHARHDPAQYDPGRLDPAQHDHRPPADEHPGGTAA